MIPRLERRMRQREGTWRYNGLWKRQVRVRAGGHAGGGWEEGPTVTGTHVRP
jgi:hypothetical protein